MTGTFSGEAVRLDLPEAGLASRLIALIMDLIVQLVVLVALLLGVGFATSGLDDAGTAAIGLVAVLAVILAMPVAVETATKGKSVGKKAMGLRVVRDDGGPVRFRHSATRGLFMVLVDLWTTAGAVGLITSLSNERGKRVGDFFGGTIVVRERFTASIPEPPPQLVLPANLEDWTAGLDLSLVSNDLIGSATSYVSRRDGLDADVRVATAHVIAAALAQQLGVQSPPPGESEQFLAVVVQEASRGGYH